MFLKILAFIKSMSLPAKIMSVAAFVVIVGSTTTAIVIVNIGRSNDQTPAQQDSVAQNDQPTETGEQPKEEEKPEGDSENPQENGQNNNQTSTQEPTTDPVQPTPTPEPEKTCSDLQNCDYNLNDQYIIETDIYNFYKLPDGVSSLCDQNESGAYYLEILPILETKTFYQIGDFTGRGGTNVPHATPTKTDYTGNQARQYASTKGLVASHDGWGCGGMGDVWRDWTWQETIDKGFALDEAKCAQWGLSCGRW